MDDMTTFTAYDIEQALREIESVRANVRGLPIMQIRPSSDMTQPDLPLDGLTHGYVFRNRDSLIQHQALETTENMQEFARRVLDYRLGTVESTANPGYSVTRDLDYSFYLFDEEDDVPKHTIRAFPDEVLREFCNQ